MNILRAYTIDYLKRNKKSSITIMLAIYIASILISSVCIYEYNMWWDLVNTTISKTGNWYGELFDATKGKDLEYIKAYAGVESVMVKGQWYVAQIEDSKRPYLIMRDADKEYWKSMPEKSAIIEGRMPTKKGEIVVSKQFVQNHKEVKLGESITLSIGQRVLGGAVLEQTSTLRAGEVFSPQGKETYTIVGLLDITTSSSIPAYTGIGYLDHQTILPEDEITVYLRFSDITKTYEQLPHLAKQIGYKQNEYGEYALKYNRDLLSKHFIFPKDKYKFSLTDFSLPIMYTLFCVLIVGVFVLIIHNAFELSMQSRKKQLGMFKSIGATPKQIRHSITFEAAVLSAIPIPLGIVTSYALFYLFVQRVNTINRTFNNHEIKFLFGVPVVIAAAAMTFITAWLSAYIPSKKIGKKMPIDILRGTPYEKSVSHKKRKTDLKVKNIYTELAANNFKAHKKAFRSSILSLTLSFLLLIVFLSGTASGNLANSIYYKTMKFTMSLRVLDGKPVEQELMQTVREDHRIKESCLMSQAIGSIWLTKDYETDEIKSIGGFEHIIDLNKYAILEKEGRYRIYTKLVGLDDETFKLYCESIGINYKDYYDIETLNTIVFNGAIDSKNSTKSNTKYMPYLKIKKGDVLTVSEQRQESDRGKYEFDTTVGALTNKLPNWDIDINDYSIVQIIPMKVYEQVVTHFDAERVPGCLSGKIQMKVEENDVVEVRKQLQEVGDQLYGTGDYFIWDIAQARSKDEAGNKVQGLIIFFGASLFTIIGISNAFSTVYSSMEHRKREFAILRSVGITSKGINKLLIKEAGLFGILPIVIAMPIELGVLLFLVKMNESSLGEFMAYMPIAPIIIFIMVIVVTTIGAYWICSSKIRKQNIVDAIKDETV